MYSASFTPLCPNGNVTKFALKLSFVYMVNFKSEHCSHHLHETPWAAIVTFHVQQWQSEWSTQAPCKASLCVTCISPAGLWRHSTNLVVAMGRRWLFRMLRLKQILLSSLSQQHNTIKLHQTTETQQTPTTNRDPFHSHLLCLWYYPGLRIVVSQGSQVLIHNLHLPTTTRVPLEESLHYRHATNANRIT